MSAPFLNLSREGFIREFVGNLSISCALAVPAAMATSFVGQGGTEADSRATSSGVSPGGLPDGMQCGVLLSIVHDGSASLPRVGR